MGSKNDEDKSSGRVIEAFTIRPSRSFSKNEEEGSQMTVIAHSEKELGHDNWKICVSTPPQNPLLGLPLAASRKEWPTNRCFQKR
jgi:hypothetical protein